MLHKPDVSSPLIFSLHFHSWLPHFPDFATAMPYQRIAVDACLFVVYTPSGFFNVTSFFTSKVSLA
jgi:hypothetical protein